MKMFKNICGEDAIDHVVLTTSRWCPPPKKEEENLETNLILHSSLFGGTGSKGVQVQRLNDKYQRSDALRVLRAFDSLGPVTLQIQYEMVDQALYYHQTTAGRELAASLKLE